MKRFLFSIIFLITFSSFAFSQNTENKKDEKEITICPIELIAKTANFRFNYRYTAKTNNKGFVTEVKKFGRDNPKFIKDEIFITCIESWKLNPSEDYFISIYVGTSFTDKYKNHILISSKTETIKIILPSIGSELVVENNKKQ